MDRRTLFLAFNGVIGVCWLVWVVLLPPADLILLAVLGVAGLAMVGTTMLAVLRPDVVQVEAPPRWTVGLLGIGMVLVILGLVVQLA